MGRRAKDGRYVNANISIDAFEMLERHCAESGQTKTVAIERAIRACYAPRDNDTGKERGRDGEKDQ